jgi:hypothetical protein
MFIKIRGKAQGADKRIIKTLSIKFRDRVRLKKIGVFRRSLPPTRG